MYPAVHAAKTPDKPAYVMAGSGEVVTYRQLDDRSNQIAQLFHALRRQVKRSWRKPLIVATPKSLLRVPTTSSGPHRPVSTIKDLSEGRFHRAIGDVAGLDPDGVKKILLCTGKLYYELAQARDARSIRDIAIAPSDNRRSSMRGRFENWSSDIRHAARRLSRAPGLALITIATLALAIGANTAIFSVVDAVLIDPLPFPIRRGWS